MQRRATEISPRLVTSRRDRRGFEEPRQWVTMESRIGGEARRLGTEITIHSFRLERGRRYISLGDSERADKRTEVRASSRVLMRNIVTTIASVWALFIAVTVQNG